MSKFTSINQPTHKRTGRPIGSTNKVTQAIKSKSTSFINMVFEKAMDDKNVDQVRYAQIAAKFIPLQKSVMPEFVIDAKGKDPKADALKVIESMFKGDIASDVALAALNTVAASSHLIDIKELEQRIDELLIAKGLMDDVA